MIKQFHPMRQDPQFLETARRLFDTEVSTLQQLGQHPQIPDFIDAFEQAGKFYLVQEFIAGSPLSTEMAVRGKFDETRAIDLLRDVLHILEFVHSNQVIHRDIKPANLIRRQPDGKIVLIDFGAVKAIQTQLALKLESQSDMGHSNFTVGIGTQGYSPSEQMVGQPRFCSDLFALGVTIIQAITGLHPTQLPLNADTGEFVWQNHASVSAAFAVILERMVRYHFSQRYQSARQVLDDLDLLYPAASRLTAFPHCDLEETRLLPPTQPQDDTLEQDPIAPSATETVPFRDSHPSAPLRKRRVWQRKVPRFLALASLGVTALVLGIQQLGGLESGELAVYDRMIRLRPPAPLDDRLLLVEISEADLQTLKRPTPADRDVAQVIRNLAEAQPRVIGLDLHRELPQEPGHADLMQQLQTH
ncbi:MAG TPA: CHASE2 domain-containing protein, partial [Allocoleopsis sp.]